MSGAKIFAQQLSGACNSSYQPVEEGASLYLCAWRSCAAPRAHPLCWEHLIGI